MNFKQLKDFDFKNIDIDRNQFERITVGVIILCALSLFGDYKNATFYQD